MLTLLVGGARSGKSALAVEWGRSFEQRGGDVVFLATATLPTVAGDDDDLATRIQRHRGDRPAWPTIEAPLDVAGAISDVADDALLVVDCLTLWTSNLLARGDDAEAIVALAENVGSDLARRPGPSVVVSNEVGLGVHPVTELGRGYRDLLGRVNRAVAACADRSLFVVAGRVAELAAPDRFAP